MLPLVPNPRDEKEHRGGIHYSFAASDELAARLRALATAETACCAFLDFDVVRTRDTLEMKGTAPERRPPRSTSSSPPAEAEQTSRRPRGAS